MYIYIYRERERTETPVLHRMMDKQSPAIEQGTTFNILG